MKLDQTSRALVLRKLVGKLQQMGMQRHATATHLSRYIGCTPDTARNTLRRYGREFGMVSVEFQHRPNVVAEYWILDEAHHDEDLDELMEMTYNAFKQSVLERFNAGN